MITPLVSSNSS